MTAVDLLRKMTARFRVAAAKVKLEELRRACGSRPDRR